jgi:hypothetical protein
VPLVRQGVKVFPASLHLLSRLRGPLAVEGGVTGADRSLRNGIKMPGETDTDLIGIGPQPPESRAIDVLNIYNDSSLQDRSGVMTQTTLRGFGMAEDLTFSGAIPDAWGEAPTFPGGISFGAIAFVDGQFVTDGGKSSIEVLNLLLGKGNDHLDIQGTLDPAPAVEAANTVTLQDGFSTPIPGDTWAGPAVVRAGFDWKAFGFLAGQSVTISGLGGTWTVVGFSFDHSAMFLTGPEFGGTSTTLRTVTATDATVNPTGTVTLATTAIGLDVTRTGGDWATDGFVVGQQVMIGGIEPTVWRLVGISTDLLAGTSTLHLRGVGLPVGTAATASRTVYVPDRHGGLTVVHGGGNRPMTRTIETTTTASSITRTDGLSWAMSGYKVGDDVQVSGVIGTRRILSFGDVTCPFTPPDDFPGCGDGSVMNFAPGALTLSVSVVGRTIHVAEPLRTVATGAMEIHASSLVRTDGGSYISDGFSVGQEVWISGLAGAWTIAALDATTMTLSGAALTPTVSIVGDTLVWAAPMLIVFGYDPALDSGVRVSGDTIVVCRPTAIPACTATTVVAGPNSPLVVYGDTSQDGVWYGGHPYDVLGAEFGNKPFDPFTNLPDGDNEDDEWVFPLADPYPYAGNDVIDASGLFAWIVCDATCSNLPTVGLTAYGGQGDDLIIGSQAGDHLAGGSGDDEIAGQRGVDHIYGDSGVNVNILTRAFDRVVNASATDATTTSGSSTTARRSSPSHPRSPTTWTPAAT